MLAFNAAVDQLIFKTDPIVSIKEWWVAAPLGFGLITLMAILFYVGISEFGHSLLLIAFISSFYFALAYAGATSAVASGPDAVAVYRMVLLKGNLGVGLGFFHTASILQLAPPKYFNMKFYNIMILVILIAALNYAIVLKERLL